jgi:hypothetical protein
MKTWKISFIIFSVFLGGFFIIPSYKKGKDLKQKNEILKKELEIKIKELKELDNDQTNLSATEASLYEKIPQNEMQESIIRTVNTILNKYNFQLQGGMSFSKGFDSDVNAAKITTSFSIIGPKNTLSPLVSAFENNKRFFGIEKLNVQVSSENGQKMVSLPISLFSFFQEK